MNMKWLLIPDSVHGVYLNTSVALDLRFSFENAST